MLFSSAAAAAVYPFPSFVHHNVWRCSASAIHPLDAVVEFPLEPHDDEAERNRPLFEKLKRNSKDKP